MLVEFDETSLDIPIVYRPHLSTTNDTSREEEFVHISIPEYVSSPIDDSIALLSNEPLRVPKTLPNRPLTILPLGHHSEEELANDLNVFLPPDDVPHRRSTCTTKGVPAPCFDGFDFSTINHYMLSNVPSAPCYSYAMALHGCSSHDWPNNHCEAMTRPNVEQWLAAEHLEI